MAEWSNPVNYNLAVVQNICEKYWLLTPKILKTTTWFSLCTCEWFIEHKIHSDYVNCELSGFFFTPDTLSVKLKYSELLLTWFFQIALLLRKQQIICIIYSKCTPHELKFEGDFIISSFISRVLCTFWFLWPERKRNYFLLSFAVFHCHLWSWVSVEQHIFNVSCLDQSHFIYSNMVLTYFRNIDFKGLKSEK